jgi:hypothetical protein
MLCSAKFLFCDLFLHQYLEQHNVSLQFLNLIETQVHHRLDPHQTFPYVTNQCHIKQVELVIQPFAKVGSPIRFRSVFVIFGHSQIGLCAQK